MGSNSSREVDVEKLNDPAQYTILDWCKCLYQRCMIVEEIIAEEDASLTLVHMALLMGP